MCTWPKEKCAEFDPWGKQIVGQGKPGNGMGEDFKLPAKGESFGRIDSFKGGTIIGLGGHLHPGGLQNEVDLVRPGREPTVLRYPAAKKRKATRKRKAQGDGRQAQRRAASASGRARCRRRGKRAATGAQGERRRCAPRAGKTEVVGDSVRIYTGQPVYWDWEDPSKPGGPPTSWDHSATVVGNPYWGVHVKPGDILRSNATYDTKIQSTYENMGIVVGAARARQAGRLPRRSRRRPVHDAQGHVPGLQVGRHQGEPAEAVRQGHRRPTATSRRTETTPGPPAPGTRAPGSPMADGGVTIADFLYEPGDFSTLSMSGVPTVPLGSNVRFTNVDGARDLPHGHLVRLPLPRPDQCVLPAGGRRRRARAAPLEFDSSQLGIGPPAIGPAKNELTLGPAGDRAGRASSRARS